MTDIWKQLGIARTHTIRRIGSIPVKKATKPYRKFPRAGCRWWIEDDIAKITEGYKKMSEDVGIITTTHEDQFAEGIRQKRRYKCLPTHVFQQKYFFSQAAFKEYTEKMSNEGYDITFFGTDYGFISKDLNFINFNIDDNTIRLSFYGCLSFLEEVKNLTGKILEECLYTIKWVYSKDGCYITIPVSSDKLPCTEMYSFLEDQTLDEYYDSFINSDSNTLLLIGPPGTGKTSFLRGLLHKAQSSAIVSYNPDILQDDSFFVDFLAGNTKYLIMEDCDNFLESRSDGNNMMHRFLNVSDGLVTVKGKKIIFTTNLPHIDSIDEALLRPGRCHDLLHFDRISKEKAEALAKKCNHKLTLDQEDYTIAEVFSNTPSKQDKPEIERKIGFGV